jgi:1D-myo-inositol 3-kinase
MPAILRPTPGSNAPQFLTIGHVTRDVHGDGSFALGGTVTFAALTAYRLGLVAAIVTCADSQLMAELPARLTGIALAFPSDSAGSAPATPRASIATTTFANSYFDGYRIQYLRDRAAPLHSEDVPVAWRAAPVVLLGPLAQELGPDFVTLFPRRPHAIIAATPQGWLRRWDAEGRVWPTPWEAAPTLLPFLDVLILSHDDLLPFANGERDAADAMLARWSEQVPLLVATDGRHGATLFQQGTTERFAAYPTHEVDPTGAGDVFAAAFLCHLYQFGNPRAAVDFANCTASFSVEKEGITGIPGLDMVKEKMRRGK